MARNVRDWNKLTEAYSFTMQKHVAVYEGRRTLAHRIQYKMARLKFQFLPHYFAEVPKWRLKLRSFGGNRILPDFACVGAIKSGTTDLGAYLFQHPCILPPLSKEIVLVNPQMWRPYYPTVREKEQVEREHGKALSGYFTPWLHNLLLIDNYHAAKPDAKIIILLRNPVNRAYSHYKADMVLGAKRAARTLYYKTFADYVDFALDLFPAVHAPSWSGVPLLPSGIYAKSVELWMDRFGSENVCIVRAEDFFKDVASTVCGVHEFLGIPPMKPEVHSVVLENPIKAPPMDEATRLKLQAFYAPYNQQLYALIDRDLGWE